MVQAIAQHALDDDADVTCFSPQVGLPSLVTSDVQVGQACDSRNILHRQGKLRMHWLPHSYCGVDGNKRHHYLCSVDGGRPRLGKSNLDFRTDRA
jgi:hypothetical protein